MFKSLKAKVYNGLVALSLVAFGATANAEGANNWTGLYLGGQVGHASADANLNFVGGGWWTFANTPFASFSLDGFAGGLHFGYGQQTSNNYFWGVEASFNASDLNQSIASPAFPAIDTWTIEVDSFWDVTGRVGYVHNQFLFYATGGLAGANVNSRATPPIDAASQSHIGYVVGLGADYMLPNGVVLGLQYKFYDFGSRTHYFNPACGPCSAGDNRNVSVDANVVMLRATSHF